MRIRIILVFLFIGLIASVSYQARADVLHFEGSVTEYEDTSGGSLFLPDLANAPIAIDLFLPDLCSSDLVPAAASVLTIGDYSFEFTGNSWNCTQNGSAYGFYLLPYDLILISGAGIEEPYRASAVFQIDAAGNLIWTLNVYSYDCCNPLARFSGNAWVLIVPGPNITENTNGTGLNLGSALFTQITMSDITITNIGNEDLLITSVSITGGDAGAFGSTSDCIGIMAQFSTCTINLTFTALAPEGTKTAAVTVISNDPDTPNLMISLTAISVADSDGDAVADSSDNCVLIANPTQRDTDGDGFGNICDADFDQNCVVNFVDLGIMQAFFLVPGDFDTDLNGDGITNFLDFSIFPSSFLQPPGPSGVTNNCDGM